ncbi:hypothetical protein AAY473_026772 [Plecturocebus cupreus]
MEKPHLYLKKYKISWACRHMPVIPATQEAETEESLEPRSEGVLLLPLQNLSCVTATCHLLFNIKGLQHTLKLASWPSVVVHAYNPSTLGGQGSRKLKGGQGVVAYACNSSTLGGRGGRSLEVRHSRPAWSTWGNPVSTKNTKISQAWWHTPVVPATEEAEMRESLGPGRWKQRLQSIWSKEHPKSADHRSRQLFRMRREQSWQEERTKGTPGREARKKDFILCYDFSQKKSDSVAQAGAQWYNHSLLQLQTPGHFFFFLNVSKKSLTVTEIDGGNWALRGCGPVSCIEVLGWQQVQRCRGIQAPLTSCRIINHHCCSLGLGWALGVAR